MSKKSSSNPISGTSKISDQIEATSISVGVIGSRKLFLSENSTLISSNFFLSILPFFVNGKLSTFIIIEGHI